MDQVPVGIAGVLNTARHPSGLLTPQQVVERLGGHVAVAGGSNRVSPIFRAPKLLG